MPDDAVFRADAAVSFLLYTVAVFVLAIFSHRLLKKKSFLKEYFIGSRGLGFWALAMSYAATSSSGGSFTGFPALIYTHGWIMALWIASYMIVPICCMGMLGKRLNQVARKTGAITVPDVFRDRFRDSNLGVLASLLLVFFLVFNLVAQFKAGAKIIERLLGDAPSFQSMASWVEWMPRTFSVLSDTTPSAGYCLALVIFAFAVITYTVYGGFRAVVWTDVLQGVVMFVGVLLLLGFTLAKIDGGLETVTRDLAKVRLVAVTLENVTEGEVTVPARTRIGIAADDDSWSLATEEAAQLAARSGQAIAARVESGGEMPREFSPETVFTIVAEGRAPRENLSGSLRDQVRVTAARARPEHTLVSGPGFKPTDELGYLPLSMAFSFFIMWAISGTGQPTTMVRLMAFSNTTVLRRAIFSVSIYYTIIYISLIVVFVCARHILPPLDDPDEAMPRMVLAVAPGFLAGIIMAAPFAAVMSTVDSFLLAISSGLVRDIYQRTLRPDASPRLLRRLSYATTLLVGVIVMFFALNPPRFLQSIIVLTGIGLSCTFLAPMFFSLYWKRMTATGVRAGMLGGFGAGFGLYVLGWLGVGGTSGIDPYHLGGFTPVVWGLVASVMGSVVGSLVTPPPPKELVDFYFKVPREGRK